MMMLMMMMMMMMMGLSPFGPVGRLWATSQGCKTFHINHTRTS
jgi:hypothetical protein